jgi:hypothetical protein
MSERMTLTAPYVFRWGGRLQGKHLGTSDMHSSIHSSSSSSSHLNHSHHHAHAASIATCDSNGNATASAGLPQKAAATASATAPLSEGSSNSTREPLDPAIVAAAAALGAEADRLLKALNLRMEQHHPEQRRKQQRQRRGMNLHRAAAAAAGDGLGFDDNPEDEVLAGDEPICMGKEYMRL